MTTPSACSSVRAHASVAALRASPSEGADSLSLGELEIPGDFSSAAALLVAAVIVPGSDVTVHGVGLNPRRTGLLDVLERMGARSRRLQPTADRRGAGRRRRAARIGAGRGDRDASRGSEPRRRAAALRPRRLPCARRDRRRGAAELRLKESDRIDGVVEELRRIGPTSARRRTASASAASPLGSGAERSTRAAITGSRCSARSRGCPPARASSCEAPRRWRPASPASSTCWRSSKRLSTV